MAWPAGVTEPGPLVVGVVIPLSTPVTEEPYWFRILPCSTSRTSWLSTSRCSSMREGVS